ncbi:thioredoxin family protein [Bacillus sp. 165]|uniref:thioredoxin family protein n=1 Tax=Bacillus sp. 165 TaxID=1529117 RepID=UPI001ADB8449|nr:thioredoxin family protein [Bacillus sp. 165]MBO9130732.1 thioredoxin family protein [Bacillus sp. 165]
MIEWTGEQAAKQILHEDRVMLYVYTPLCGTCQLAKKMITVIEAALPSLTIGMLDLNYSPQLARDFQIESVPCLLLFQKGKMVKRIYAFQSVEYLYHELKDWQ